MISSSAYNQNPKILSFSCKNELFNFISKDYLLDSTFDFQQESNLLTKDLTQNEAFEMSKSYEAIESNSLNSWLGGYEYNYDFETNLPIKSEEYDFAPLCVSPKYTLLENEIDFAIEPVSHETDQKIRAKKTGYEEGVLTITTIKLMNFIRENMDENNVFCTKDIDKVLNSHKRRIYDVLNVLESVNLIKHIGINLYMWQCDGYFQQDQMTVYEKASNALREEIEELADIESEYDKLIQNMEQEISKLKNQCQLSCFN